MLLFCLVLIFGFFGTGGSLWALCIPNLQSFLVLVMDLTSVVSALRLIQQIIVALFACLQDILLEVCLLGILFGAFISFF